MSMFNKLIRKGGQLAGDYVRGQLEQRTGAHPGNSQPRTEDRAPADGAHRSPSAPQPGSSASQDAAAGLAVQDHEAIAKYKYMLRTAPPEQMEQAHAQSFARLTPQQRAAVHSSLTEQLPAAERPPTNRPEDLARAVTRAEISRPGFMDQLLARSDRTTPGRGGGLAAGVAGGLGAGLLVGVAGAFTGTAIAGPLLEGFAGIGQDLSGGLGQATDGWTEAATGATGDLTGAAEQILPPGESAVDQAGGLFDRFLGGEGLFGNTER